MKDRFPKSVPVHGFRIPVKWSKDIKSEDTDAEGNPEEISVYGLYECEAPRPRIVLHPGQSYEMAVNSFAHEVIHAWLDATGIIDTKQEEVVVRSLTPLLVQLLKEWKKHG